MRAHPFYPIADKFNSIISGTPSAEAMSHARSLRVGHARGRFRDNAAARFSAEMLLTLLRDADHFDPELRRNRKTVMPAGCKDHGPVTRFNCRKLFEILKYTVKSNVWNLGLAHLVSFREDF